jgi:hypothetical protein
MPYLILFVFELVILFLLSRRIQGAVSNILYKITKNQKWTIWMMAIFFIIGTFVHEISHLITGLLLFVPVGELELIPEFQDEKVKMGSVKIGKTDPVRRFLVGISPLIFGISIIGLLVNLVSIHRCIDSWQCYAGIALAFFLVFQIANTMFASRRDMEGSYKLLLIIILVIAVIVSIFGSPANYNLVLSESFVNLLKMIDYYLAVPLIIDVIAILAYRFIK